MRLNIYSVLILGTWYMYQYFSVAYGILQLIRIELIKHLPDKIIDSFVRTLKEDQVR